MGAQFLDGEPNLDLTKAGRGFGPCGKENKMASIAGEGLVYRGAAQDSAADCNPEITVKADNFAN